MKQDSAAATPPASRIATFASNRRRLLVMVGWVAAVAILWLAIRRVDWTTLRTVLLNARLPWVVAAIVLNALVLPLWSAGWYALWRDASLDQAAVRPPRFVVFEVNAVISALGNTVPFLLSTTTTIAMLARRGRLGSRGAITLVAFDQAFEGVSKVVLFAVVALTMPLPDWMGRGIVVVCLLVAAVVAVVAIGHRVIRRRQPVIPAAMSATRASTVVVLFLAMKVLEALAIVAVQRSVGIALPFTAALFVLAVVLLGTIVPVAPASLGPYEIAAVGAYRYLGLPLDVCVALAIVQHVCFLIPAIGTGYLVLAGRTIRGNREQGTGNREQGTGNREQGTGNRE